MKEFVCNKCNSVDLFIKNNDTHVGLYCSDCGKWIKWLNKEEQRIFEKQIVKIDLSQVTNEELLNEIKKRMNIK